MPRGLGLYNPRNPSHPGNAPIRRTDLCPAAEIELAAGAGELSCVICMERSVKTVLLDCGHAIMCIACCRQIMVHGNKRCPICKAAVCKAIKVFTA